MSQIIHCCMLLFIVFIIAEIRNVLLHTDPRESAPITIWDEVQPQLDEDKLTLIYKA